MGDESVDVEEFRALLLALRAEILGDNRQLKKDADMSGSGTTEAARAPIHMAESASDTTEKHIMFERLSASSETLQMIDDALIRIDEGTYGLCEECGQSIPARRLRIKPYASLCIDCRRKEEIS